MAKSSAIRRNQHTPKVIAVIGATGNCGATTFAVACASVLGGAAPPILLDLQAASGLEVLLAIESDHGIRTAELGTASGALNLQDLQQFLPRYLGIPVLTDSVSNPFNIPLATTQALVDGAKDYQGWVVAIGSAEVLVSLNTEWDAIICISPLTLVGAARTLALKRLLNSPYFNLVTTAITRPEFTIAQFEKASGQKAIGHVEPCKEVHTASSLGNGPLGSPSRHIAKFRDQAMSVLHGLVARD